MPIYEYSCQQCGHRMDVLQKISDEPKTICPACQNPALVKWVSAAGFRLSGSGWYETDFKKETDKKRNLNQPEKQPEKTETTAASTTPAKSKSSEGQSGSTGTATTTTEKANKK